MATFCPSNCRDLIVPALSAGRTSAITSVIPTWAAIASAVVRLSPLSMITRTPRRRSRATACSASGLTVSATAITPRI